MKKDKKVINNDILFFNLDRDIRLKDINDIERMPEFSLKEEKIKKMYERIKDGEYSDELINFSSVLLNRFDNNDLRIFYNNISFLEIKNYTELKHSKKYKYNLELLGYYKPSNNTIYLSNQKDISFIYHELFHMSTYMRTDRYLFFGFEQYDLVDKTSFGKAINEGYTQLLAHRYFNVSSESNYYFLVYQLQFLETIIGKEKMESLYMNADLYGLVDELKKYAYYKDISKFITYFDYILDNLYVSKKNYSNRKLAIIGQMFTYINIFLLNTYLNKLKLNKPTNEEEYYQMADDINSFLDKLVYEIKIKNKFINCSFANNLEFLEKIKEDLNELEFDCDFSHQKKLV